MVTLGCWILKIKAAKKHLWNIRSLAKLSDTPVETSFIILQLPA